MNYAALIINLIFWLPVSGAAIYLTVLTVAAFRNPGRRLISGRFEAPLENPARFILLIPAHDEEPVIERTLQGTRQIDYPAGCFETVVLADNCSDRTAEIARAFGATVLERHDPDNRGKGQALDWAFKTQFTEWPYEFDALVIMDADAELSPDFFKFCSEKVRNGTRLFQSYNTVGNPADNWRTSLLAIALSVFHFLRPLGRDRLGFSCGLRGNGMGISRELLTTYGYPAHSVVEDVELTVFFLLKGIHADFIPGAHTFSRMETSSKSAGTQRTRWENGRFGLVRSCCPPLFRGWVKTGKTDLLDGLLDLLVPPFSIPVLITFAGIFFNACALWFSDAAAFPVWLLLWIAAALLETLYIISGLILIRAPFYLYRRLLTAPFYVLWKGGIYVQMALKNLTGNNKEWIRTARITEKEKPE